jgi:hypothetical protein
MRSLRSAGAGALMLCALAIAGCSGHAERASVSAGSHDQGVRLAPEVADATSQLAVVLDVPGIDAANCRYVWHRNGALLEAETRNVLEPSNFRKGDDVEVAVTLPEQAPGGARTLSARVRIADAPPGVTSAQLTMTASTSGCEFRGSSDCSDPDGDSTTCEYRWFRNGQLISGAREAGLSVASMNRGDRIVVEVVASDGERKSEPRRSNEFVLENRPPQFTSQPLAIKPGETVFHYQAVAVDPDGDVVRYELVRGPAGTTIAPDGSVDWTVPPKAQRQGDSQIVIKATDSKGGEATQTIDLRMEPGAPKSTGA